MSATLLSQTGRRGRGGSKLGRKEGKGELGREAVGVRARASFQAAPPKFPGPSNIRNMKREYGKTE